MSSALSRPELRAAIEDVLYAGCLHLDERRFEAWLELTAPELRYRIAAYSPDIRKEMTWLDHDRAGLVALFELLPKHHVDGSPWNRHVVLYTLESDGGDTVRTVSSLAIFRTTVDIGDAHIDGGSSHLFAVGRYHDRWKSDGDRWLLVERTARLDTRQLGTGSHLIV